MTLQLCLAEYGVHVLYMCFFFLFFFLYIGEIFIHELQTIFWGEVLASFGRIIVQLLAYASIIKIKENGV